MGVWERGTIANEDDRSRRIATRRAPAPQSRSRSCRRKRRNSRDHRLEMRQGYGKRGLRSMVVDMHW
jgi:hypothetical protein